MRDCLFLLNLVETLTNLAIWVFFVISCLGVAGRSKEYHTYPSGGGGADLYSACLMLQYGGASKIYIYSDYMEKTIDPEILLFLLKEESPRALCIPVSLAGLQYGGSNSR